MEEEVVVSELLHSSSVYIDDDKSVYDYDNETINNDDDTNATYEQVQESTDREDETINNDDDTNATYEQVYAVNVICCDYIED